MQRAMPRSSFLLYLDELSIEETGLSKFARHSAPGATAYLSDAMKEVGRNSSLNDFASHYPNVRTTNGS